MVAGEHARTLKLSRSKLRGKIGQANRAIRSNGWSQNISVFWELLWMRPTFYKCFGICFLHLELLGLLKVDLPFILLSLTYFFNCIY
jgi:hypothetical protein